MKNIITIISLILLSLNVFGQANPNIDLSLSPSTVALNTNSILTATASNFGNGADIVGNSLRLTVQVGVNAEILGLAPGSSTNWTLLSFTTAAGNQYQLKNVGSVLDFQQDEIKFIVKGIVVSGATLISGNITYLPGINTLLSPPAPNASQGNSTTVDDNALTALIVTAPAAPLVASATFLPINCNGGTTTITVSATGGTPPYSGTGAFSVFANTYVYTVTDANGATSATTAVVNQPASLVGSSNVIACNSATLVGYSGNPVTATGLYPVSYTNAAGCDSVHTYNVTINTGTFNATTATACNTYTWLANAVTYTTSGTYTYSYLNANGCASVDTLHLTINTGTFNATSATACNTYTWLANGVAYTSSGNYTYSYTNANGCASVDTLHLTINSGTFNATSSTSCNTYTWLANGVTYNATGNYTYSYTNANGCASVDTLHLTINTGTFNATTVAACNSYLWPTNGILYTTSGTFIHNYTNANGCDSYDTLHLTINTGTFNATSATACNTYTWLANGVTYTASGNYTYSYVNANGCASVDTLHLTINSSTSNTTAQTACNSYTWPLNGTTYSASGTYSVTSTNAAGCTHVEILNLTINLSTSNTSGLTVCDTYTWPVNNVTYTATGSYSVTSVNAAGCTHTEILNLTVYNSTTSNTSITAVGSYLWPVTGITYTTGGTYTNIGSNTFGCPKYDTLVLTITPMLVVVSAKAMLAGPYVSATGLMRDDLRTKNLIPFAQPYGTAPYVAGFTHVGGGSETVSAAVLAVSGNDAIVDWVFVSLRSAANPATVVQTQAALIQRDGDIVSASDGVSPLTFTAIPGYYFVAVDHRNHLGIVTADSFALSATNTALNLANGSTALHVNATNNNPAPLTGATKNFSGVRALYAGNCNIANVLLSKQVSYGPATTTDRAALFTATGGTATINAYTIFDVDMNGFARYNGLNPDRAVISNTVNNSNVIIAHEQQP
jgi:hypothetical protein